MGRGGFFVIIGTYFMYEFFSIYKLISIMHIQVYYFIKIITLYGKIGSLFIKSELFVIDFDKLVVSPLIQVKHLYDFLLNAN